MNVEQLLNDLGLSKYAGVFSHNEIDAATLPELTEADLKELGLPMGPRKKLLKAIAELPQNSLETAGSSAALEFDEGRRQLTVMFVDLVGSTRLSEQLDPEDLRQLLADYQATVKRVFEKYDGFIAHYMGDGVMAYFGYPRAHEDDPERAAHAALAVIQEVKDLHLDARALDGEKLAVRIGIATGPVVVGHLIGEGSSEEHAVVGETPNLAARLQALAAPDTVVVGQQTRQLLGEGFTYEYLGAHSVKGFSQPVGAYRVITSRYVESRFELHSANRSTLMIGREAEAGLLASRWNQVTQGDGQAVILSGDPGVGKSRLVQEFRQSIKPQEHAVIQLQCASFHVNSALQPIIDHLARAAGIHNTDPPYVQLEKIEGILLPAERPTAETTALLANLLSIETADDLNLAPQRLLDEILSVITEQLIALSQIQPVLMVFEDVHWSDPTTLDLIERIMRAMQGNAVLLLVTHRPEFVPNWAGGGRVSGLTLNNLTQSQTKELIVRIADGRSLPEDVLIQVVERTDGVPLFVEELTALVFESGVNSGASGSSEAGASPLMTIPATLKDSLMGRLDRLGAAKEVAQIGATIGREFDYELIRRVSGISDDELGRQITRLCNSDLVYEITGSQIHKFVFKHALVQDAAYGSLLRATQRDYHRRIADTLVNDFPEIAQASPEVVARHFTNARCPELAAGYWQLAGAMAVRRSANTEAIRHLNNGIEALRACEPSPEVALQELNLQISLGAPLIAARGYAAEELEVAFTRARALCAKVAVEDRERFRVLWGLGAYYLIRGQLKTAGELQKECVEIARKKQNTTLLIEANAWTGTVLFYRNQLQQARSHLQEALTGYESLDAPAHAFDFGLDPAVLSLVHLMWMSWMLGEHAEAQRLNDQVMAHAETLGHPLSATHALNFSILHHHLHGNHVLAQQQAELQIERAQRLEFPHYTAYATILKGSCLAAQGAVEEGIEAMRAGLEARRATGAELARPLFLTLLAQAYCKLSDTERAGAALDEAAGIIHATDERWWEPEVHRVKGELLLLTTNDDRQLQPAARQQAEASIRHALTIAQDSGARSLELRAAMGLCRLRASQPDTVESEREEIIALRQLYAAFGDGVETADLHEARKLLNGP